MSLIYWLICFVVAAIPAWLVFRKDRNRSITVKWLPALLRFFTFFLTVALLLAPAFPNRKIIEDKPLVLWLQDESSSMQQALGKDSQNFRNKTLDFLTKKNSSYETVALGFGKKLTKDSLFTYRQDVTDIASGIEDALRAYQSSNVGAVVLVSDGNYNIGSNPVYALGETMIPVYTVGIGDSTKPKDLSVSFARANKTVLKGNTFELMANVQAKKLSGNRGLLRIINNGKVLARQEFTVKNNFYNETFRFYIPADEKGLQQYQIVVEPMEGEQNRNNNSKSVFVKVIEKDISIYIAASAPHPDIAAIKEALDKNPEYKIKIQYGADIPSSVLGYDLLITHNLPDGYGRQLPAHGQMPVWYIIGSNTDLNGFSKSQNLLRILSGSGVDNAMPELNSAFNLFALPKDIRSVIAQVPPLKSGIGNYQLSGGEVLLYQKSSVSGQRNPLWVIENGTTPQAVLAGTEIWRWRTYSFKTFKESETVDDLIRQTIALLTHQSNKEPFQILLPKYQFPDHEPIRFSASLQDATGGLTNVPNAHLVLTDSSGNERKFTFDRSGKSYVLSIGNLSGGTYKYTGYVDFAGKKYSDLGSFRVETVPLEKLKTYSDYSVLYQLSRNTGGKFYTLQSVDKLSKDLADNVNMKPLMREEVSYLQWIDLKWLFFVILLIAATEWALRKYWGI